MDLCLWWCARRSKLHLIRCWVPCLQGQILDSKEFYAPIITPYEAQLAFLPERPDTNSSYRLDFDSLLECQVCSIRPWPHEAIIVTSFVMSAHSAYL